MSETLYQAFLDGDKDAFTELVHRYREPLTHFILRFVGNYDTAEDLAADVFVEVLEKRNYRFASAFRSWLFSIARHKAIDHIRKHRREYPLEEAEHLCDPTPGPEDALLKAERREAANAALRELKDDRRMALFLTAVEGMSYEEAAAVLHKTPRQIKNLCYRARQQLRQEVEQYENR